MAGNLENILLKGDCIPEEILLQHIEGNLPAKETHLVEKHLLECELCSDALDGLKMMSPSNARDTVADLNREIDIRVAQSNNRGRVIPFSRYYKIAAAIALLILSGGSYWYLKNMNQEKLLVDNTPLPVSVHADSASTQLQPQTYSNQSPPEPVKAAPKLSLQTQTFPTDQKQDEKPSDELLTVNKAEEGKDDAAKQLNDYSNDKKSNAVVEEKEPVADVASASGKPSSREAQTAANTPAITESNMMVLDKASNERRADYSAKKIPGSKDETQQLFAVAKANYDQKKYDEAAIDFEKLINDTASLNYDDAKWFLANCYIKIHKNIKSKRLLKEIVHSNSIHRKEAEGLLQESQ